MKMPSFMQVVTALAGTTLILGIMEARRQRFARGESDQQTSERDQQALRAMFEILQDTRQNDSDPINLLNHSGLSAATIGLEAFSDSQPELGQKLIHYCQAYQMAQKLNSLVSSATNSTSTNSVTSTPLLEAAPEERVPDVVPRKGV